MNKPVLSIFADGVRYDSLKYMPFLSSLNNVPLKTILGYSITCHPSMYTGVYPDKHKIAFHWIREPKTSPYKAARYIPDIFPLSSPYAHALISKLITYNNKENKAFCGYSKIVNSPYSFWPYIDVNEKKYWDEDGYVNKSIKTIFEIARVENIKYFVSRLHKPNVGKLDYIEIAEPHKYDWIYYFVGETDSISHHFGPHSITMMKYLKRLDSFVEERYSEFQKEYENFIFFLWSDHGHIPIKKRINLYSEFKKRGIKLNDIFHIIDSTMARFWPSNQKEENQIISAMEDVEDATLLLKQDLLALRLPCDERLYGKLFYYLEGGCVFSPTIHGFGKKVISMHGYHPEADGNNGLFVSDRHIVGNEANLPDIFATFIDAFGVDEKYLENTDGRNRIS